MSITNWIFVWENTKNKPWDNASRNLNMIPDFEHTLDMYDKKGDVKNLILNSGVVDNLNISVPVNKNHIPEQFKALPITDNFKGQILDQFESESFKYVIQKHIESRYNQNHQLVLKEHLYPNIALDKNNCKTLDLDHIKKLLDENEWVGLGTFFDKPQNEFDKLNAIASSVFFTRDKDTLKIKNLSNIKQFNIRAEYLSCINYMIFKKLKDSDIVVGLLNPNLLSLTHFTNMNTENHIVTTVSGADKLADYFFKPKILKGVGLENNTIFSENGVVEIEMCGLSPYKYMHGHIANFDKKIKTNLEYAIEGEVIKIDVVKNGYLIIDYDVGNMFDYNFDKTEMHKERVEFTLFRE